MKINELYEQIKSWCTYTEIKDTVDCYKIGTGDNEIKKVGITMFPTVDVIKYCARNGINFLITHESIYYSHRDDSIPNEIAQKKKELAEENGLTIARFHDFPHNAVPDMICAGELKYLGLKGKWTKGKYFAVNNFLLDEPVTAAELARTIGEKLDLRHVRTAGCTDKPGRKIACCFGTPGHIEEELFENDFVLTGEICEWSVGELARDCAQLGLNKAIIVLSHIGSERAGMMYLNDLINERIPGICCEYIECGEVYN